MNRTLPGVLIAAGVLVSAAVTWRLVRPEDRAAVAPPPSASPVRETALPSPPQPTAPDAPAADLTPDPQTLVPARPRDDQTVDWMRSVARDRADSKIPADLAERIEKLHAAFARTREDPPWAATVEPLLREHLQASAVPGLTATSVACRADGCEVQAQILLTTGPWQFPIELLDTRVGDEGSAISRQIAVDDSATVHLGDRMGVLIEYRRIASVPR